MKTPKRVSDHGVGVVREPEQLVEPNAGDVVIITDRCVTVHDHILIIVMVLRRRRGARTRDLHRVEVVLLLLS